MAEENIDSKIEMLSILSEYPTDNPMVQTENDTKAFLEAIKADRKNVGKQEFEETPKEPITNSDEEVKNQNDLEEGDLEDEETEDESIEDVDDIFGVLKTKKPKKEIKLNFEPPKELLDLISKKYSIKDMPTFFNSVDTFRKQAEEGVKAKQSLEQIQNYFNSMPPDLARANFLYDSGEDYTTAFQQRLDFSQDFEKQNIEGLVQHYFSKEYSEEKDKLENGDISDAEFDRSVKLLASTTKKLFDKDKKSFNDSVSKFEETRKEKIQQVKTSAIDSVNRFSEEYPNFSKTELTKIQNILVGGEADNLLFESDGTYKPDVAEKIAFAMYGKKMLENAKKIAERRGESKAREEIVDLSDKKIKTKNQNSNLNKVDEDLKSISHLFIPEKKSVFGY
jgi:hypothetical protein